LDYLPLNMSTLHFRSMLLAVMALLTIQTVSFSQQQLDLLVDPLNIDWKDRNLGQQDFSETFSAVEANGLWYFNAYDENKGYAIWETDLTPEGTRYFAALPSHRLFFMQGTLGDWIFYSYLDTDGNYFPRALQLSTKEDVALLKRDGEEGIQTRDLKFFGNYAYVCLGDSIYRQDLSQLPETVLTAAHNPGGGCYSYYPLDEKRIMITAVSTTGPPMVYYAEEDKVVFLADLIGQPAARLYNVQQHQERFYFQIRPTMFGEFRLMESDWDFSAASTRLLHTREGQFLLAEEDKIYYSDANGFNNSLDVYQLPEGNLIKSISLPEFNSLRWKSMQKVRDNGYLLLSDNDRYFHYFDADKQSLTHLELPPIANNSETQAFVTEDVLLYYVRDASRNYCWYFSFDDPQRKVVFESIARQPEPLKILATLPGNKMLMLAHSETIGAEFAVADINSDTFNYLEDICRETFGSNKRITFVRGTQDGNVLFSLNNEIRNELFLYDATHRKAVNISDYYEGPALKVNRFFYDDELGLPDDRTFQGHVAETSTDIYFRALEVYDAETYLYRFDKASTRVTKIAEVNASDKLIAAPDGQLIIFKGRGPQGLNNGRDEVLLLVGDALLPIFQGDYSFCPERNYNLNTFHFFKGYFYFSADEKLYSLHLGTRELSLLVDNLPNTYGNCKENLVRFDNFLIVDGELYLTESRRGIYEFFGIELMTGEQEFSFWKTDGTAAETVQLPSFELEQNLSFYGINFHGLVHQGKLYLLATKPGNLSSSLMKWDGNTWVEVPILVNGVAESTLPFYINKEYNWPKMYLSDASNQGHDFDFGGGAYLRARVDPLPYNKESLLRWKVDSAAHFDVVFESEEAVSENDPPYNKSVLPSFILNQQWFMPYSYTRPGAGFDYEIKAWSLPKGQETSTVEKGTFLHGEFRSVVNSYDGQSAYIKILHPDTKRYQLYQVSACAPLSEVLSLSTADIACSDGFLRAQFKGSSDYSRIQLEVDGSPFSFNYEIDSNTGDWLIATPLSPGTYQFDFSFDDDCDISPLLSKTIVIIDEQPEVSVNSTYLEIGAQYLYTADNSSFQSYLWQVEGGTIIEGQGSPAVTVDWGSSTEGLLSLVVEQNGCSSDAVEVSYLSTGIRLLSSLPANIFPNPSNDVVHIRITELLEPINVSLHAVSGQLLHTAIISEPHFSIDMSGFAGGLYLLTLQDSGRHQTYRVVVF
jgi:ELWxxDGT repeat protein